MSDIKVYLRKGKLMEKEKERLEVQKNWVPNTPAKPLVVRPQNLYARRSQKGKSSLSFLARISEKEADDKSTRTSAGANEEEEKDEISKNVARSLLGFDGLLDLNKIICDHDVVGVALCGSNENGDSGNHLLEYGTADHGGEPACFVVNNSGNSGNGDFSREENHGVRRFDICTAVESNEALDDRNAPLDIMPPVKLLSYPCVVPSVSQEFSIVKTQQAIDRRADVSFQVLDSQSDMNYPEHVRENFLPEIHNFSVSLHLKNETNDPESHATQCNQEKNSIEKPHPVESLEPATPLLKHNKRPSNDTDMNQRQLKKLKSKKKKHRPKVAVEGRSRRTVMNLTPKKEKRKYVRKTQKGEKQEKRSYVRKYQSVKRGKTENNTNIIFGNLRLQSVANQTSDDNIVAVVQSSVGGGPEAAVSADQGSDEKILSTIPKLATSHSSDDKVTAMLDLNLDIKPTLESYLDKNIGGHNLFADLNLDVNSFRWRTYGKRTARHPCIKKNIGCRYMSLRNPRLKKKIGYQYMPSGDHKNQSGSNSRKDELSFPRSCKRTRTKRRRKSKVSNILDFYRLMGHQKKKRSKGFLRRRNMVSLAMCNHIPNIPSNQTHHELEICEDSQVGLLGKTVVGDTKRMEEEFVSYSLEQLPIGERNVPESSFEMGYFLEQAFGEIKGTEEDLIGTPTDLLLINKVQEQNCERNLFWSCTEEGFPLQREPTSVVEPQNYEIKGTKKCIHMKPSSVYSRSLHQHTSLIVRPTGTQLVLNHKDIVIKKNKEVLSRGIKSIIDKFMSLRISDIGAIVPHQGSLSTSKGAIIPHQGSLSTKKQKSKLRLLIALDSETVRQWIRIKRKEDGMVEEQAEANEEGEKKWAEEGKIFCGRKDLFTFRMRKLLGDRTFKEWSGSVVDSVVGVFLTQNVSDFLSSSAYMSLAAKFPVKTNGTDKDSHRGPYYVTEPELEIPEDIGGMSLVDIEDIGNPVVPKMSYRHENQSLRCQNPETAFREKKKINPILSSTMLNSLKANSASISPPDFREFFEICSSSSGAYHGSDNFELVGDYQAENITEEKASPGTSFLPQECFSLAEVGIKRNLDSLDGVNDKEVVERFDVASNPAANATSMLNKRSDPAPKGAKKTTGGKKNVEQRDWDSLRRKYSRPRTREQTDSVDWEAVRRTDTNVIAEIIKLRGQHTIIAERIKGCLDRIVELHGSIDLEWLRYAPPHLVKEYLLDVRGLGLKSVECLRLLTLHHVAFPVDVNVARIAVRLGWVPLQPLPGDLQFHLLEEYPLMDSVQQYLWPRLCTFDHRTLYELHYQMITFGKVFCTKRNPNCMPCPMKAECRHYASAVASANLSLPGPSKKSVERSMVPSMPVVNPHSVQEHAGVGNQISVSLLGSEVTPESGVNIQNCEPLIEEPKSPEHEQNIQDFENSGDVNDGEDIDDKEEEIPIIKLNNEELRENVEYFMDKYTNNLENGNSSRALVPLSVDVDSSPVQKLKRINHLRTEHLVYEIPDGHEILRGLEKRDSEDHLPYLLAIWTAGETPGSVEQPKKRCNSQGSELCNDLKCFSCQSICEERAGIVRGTILVPCRTAMRGRFPLNGTYFQINEVFAEHESSHNPITVPRKSIYNLTRRTVYFGTSPSAIFRRENERDIQLNFWRGFICLRGWDRRTGAPHPLAARFHCSPSKITKKSQS